MTRPEVKQIKNQRQMFIPPGETRGKILQEKSGFLRSPKSKMNGKNDNLLTVNLVLDLGYVVSS